MAKPDKPKPNYDEKAEAEDIMGDAPPAELPKPFVSCPVQYHKGAEEKWAAIVTKVKTEGKVDLYLFRPDGVHQCFFDVPRRGGKVLLGCWEMAEELL